MIRLLLIAVLSCFGMSCLIPVSNASTQLGEIAFPTSGSGAAQKHFIHGIAALHSFWYTEAINAFQKSTQVDPSFAMGYWGEALAYNRPLWEEQDIKSAKHTLSKIVDTSRLSQREKDYINALHLLYGDEQKVLRDKAYSNAMKKIYTNYPEDLEAACLYSLSLLGASRNTSNNLPLRIESGAIALEVYEKNPNHPCAAHYAIHAFDTPELARLALPSAHRYSKIAPASHHAQHMPAHIFVQLGMWPEAEKSNKSGWAVSVNWVERENLSKSMRDYHSLQWLHYVYLQQGLTKKAETVFDIQTKDMLEGIKDAKESKPFPNLRAGKYYYRMLAAKILETEQWDKADRITPLKDENPKGYSKAEYNFVKGFAAAMQGRPEAKKYFSELESFRKKELNKNYFKRSENIKIWELEIKAAIKLYEKDYVSAIQLANQAVLIEKKLPAPSGPPRVLKPTYEFLGEVYLKSGKPKKAKEQFDISLTRHHNRMRSLIGFARSARLNDEIELAQEKYEQLLYILKNSPKDFPERKEAETFLERLKP